MTIQRGDPIDLHIPITRKGNPVDISGWTNFNVFIKGTSSADDQDALIDLKLTDDPPAITIIDGPGGIIEAAVPAAATQALENKPRTLYCDVLGTDETGTTWTLNRGKIVIKNKAAIKLPFHPNQIAGLKLWLRADQGLYQDASATKAAIQNNDPAGGWKGPGATHTFSQGTLSKRPVKHTAALASLPAVKGDGTGTYLQGPNLVNFTKNEEFTLFMVARGNVDDNTGAAVTEWPPFLSDQGGAFALALGGQMPDDPDNLGASIGLYTFDGLIDAEVKTPFDPSGWVLIEARHGAALTDHSGALALDATAQQIMDENDARTSFTLTNASAQDLWLTWGTALTPEEIVPGVGLRVQAAKTYIVAANVRTDPLFIVGAAQGQRWEATEGTGVIGVRVDGFEAEATQVCGQAQTKDASKALATPLYLLGNPDGRPYLAGEIAELCMWNTHLTDADKAKVRGYFHARWGVPALGADVTPDQ